jgi:hypothetical protein
MWENCKTDPSVVGMSSSKVSCPPMQCAIHHEDRSLLSEAEWKVIHHSVTFVICSNLDHPCCPSQAHQPHKKMHFKCYFLMEWTLALHKLKSLPPLLSLCAGEYKADMTLSLALQDKVTCKQCNTTATPIDSHTLSPSNLGISLSHGTHSSCGTSCGTSSHISPPHDTTPSSCGACSSCGP